jgi:hypothetical protein
MRIEQPFDADACTHLNLHEVHVGMSLQVDDKFRKISMLSDEFFPPGARVQKNALGKVVPSAINRARSF